MFKKNKAQIKLFMWLIMATLSFVIILGLWKLAFSKAPDKAAEDACFIFNSIRTKAKLEIAGKEILGVPRACKKIEKTGDKSIPEDIYQQNSKGAKDQLSNMIAKCWWMWLEGRDPNIMETELFSSKNKCFICYQFDVDKKISLPVKKFDIELSKKTYRVEDSSDKCAGQFGGYCVDESACGKDSKIEGKCQEDKVCCIHKKNICENKGGICKEICDTISDDGEVLHTDWKCGEKSSCCIKKENQLTYYEYVQQFGGPGKIIIDESIGDFDFRGTYAVTFIAKTDKYILVRLPTLENLVPIEDLTKDISSIYVSRLSDVDGKCDIELGVEAGISG